MQLMKLTGIQYILIYTSCIIQYGAGKVNRFARKYITFSETLFIFTTKCHLFVSNS